MTIGRLVTKEPTLFGRTIEQELSVVCIFDILFGNFKPKRIVEWGAGRGGLSMYLAVWSNLLDAKMLSIDIWNREGVMDFLAKFPGKNFEARIEDIHKNPQYSKEFFLAEDGPSLFLCDGGNKPRELCIAAPWMRKGDILMAHDYHKKNPEVTEYEVDDLKERFGFSHYMQNFWDAGETCWLCLRKN